MVELKKIYWALDSSRRAFLSGREGYLNEVVKIQKPLIDGTLTGDSESTRKNILFTAISEGAVINHGNSHWSALIALKRLLSN
jgi:hypothetical protein